MKPAFWKLFAVADLASLSLHLAAFIFIYLFSKVLGKSSDFFLCYFRLWQQHETVCSNCPSWLRIKFWLIHSKYKHKYLNTLLVFP